MIIWSFNVKLSESEFLRREFNLTLKKISRHDVANLVKKKILIIATSNIRELEEIFDKSKINQIILFWFGNETYNVDEYIFLNHYSNKIKIAFIDLYPKKSMILYSIYSWLGCVLDGGLLFKNQSGSFLRTLKNGLDLRFRVSNLIANYKYVHFPHGYSSQFSKVYARLHKLKSTESLIKNPLPRVKKTQVSFVGGTGSWCRNLALKILENSSYTKKTVLRSGWGKLRNKDILEYIFLTCESVITLCPPGNICGKTHRRLESMLCGSLPISLPISMQDPNDCDSLFNKKNPFNYSWKLLIRRTSKYSENKILRMIQTSIDSEVNAIDNVKKILKETIVAGAGIEPAT